MASPNLSRYARAKAPSRPENLPNYLDSEYAKLERVIDALVARLVALEP